MPHRGRIRAAEREGFFNGFRQPIPKKDAQLCLATSKDLIHWERKGVILPAYKGNWNVGWTKSGAIVPEKINGQCWMYFLGTSPDKTDQTGLVFSTDLIHWTEATQQPVLPKRAGKFDSRVVEPGPPPIVTDRGIVLIYAVLFLFIMAPMTGSNIAQAWLYSTTTIRESCSGAATLQSFGP